MTEKRIFPTQPAPMSTGVPMETDWHAAGCSKFCRWGHTREVGVCAYAPAAIGSTAMAYCAVTYTAADGERSLAFRPVEPEPRPPVWRRGDYWAGVSAGVGIGVLAVMVLRLMGLG